MPTTEDASDRIGTSDRIGASDRMHANDRIGTSGRMGTSDRMHANDRGCMDVSPMGLMTATKTGGIFFIHPYARAS